jgi:hypothetical protein
MSEKRDEAWDEDSKEEPEAQSGEGEVHRVDTVPPPASGDAYSADTVIRDVPPEALEAIRERRKNSENRRAAERVDDAKNAATSDAPAARQTEIKTPVVEAEIASDEKPIVKPAAHAPSRAPLPPVTASELTIALAAAVALIVIAFYVIGSAF